MTALLLTAALMFGPGSAIDAAMEDYETFQGHIAVAEGEAVLAERLYGEAAAGRPMTAEEIWRWSSVTKQILAVLILQHVEAGTLSLDDTVAERLPAFETAYSQTITLRDLLRHTSGLPGINLSRVPIHADLSSTQRLAMCGGEGGEPGGRFVYNNCDSVLAGAILEAATGERWEATLQRRVFEPAGMTQSGVFDGQSNPETVLGFAESGATRERGRPNLFGAGGAVYGPVSDLVRFNAALMDGRLLRADSLEILWDGDASRGFVALGAWSYAARLDGCEEPVRLVERHGETGQHAARNFLAPELGRSLVVMSNFSGTDFGQIWMGDGLSFDLASAAFCSR